MEFIRDDAVQNNASGKGAEHDIEFKDCRNRHEDGQNQDDKTQDRLVGGARTGDKGCLHPGDRRSDSCRHDGNGYSDGDEEQQNDHRRQRGTSTQQQRHSGNGGHLTNGTMNHHGVAHLGAQNAVLFQHWRERAQRR